MINSSVFKLESVSFTHQTFEILVQKGPEIVGTNQS